VTVISPGLQNNGTATNVILQNTGVVSLVAGSGIGVMDEGGGTWQITNTASAYTAGVGIDISSTGVISNTGIVSVVGINNSTDVVNNGNGNWSVYAALQQPNKFYTGYLDGNVSVRGGTVSFTTLATIAGPSVPVNYLCQSFSGIIFSANLNYYTDNTGSINEYCKASFRCADVAYSPPTTAVFISAPQSNPGGGYNVSANVTILMRYGIHYDSNTTQLIFAGYVEQYDSRLCINNQGFNQWQILGIN
jgi:hypothetical protein